MLGEPMYQGLTLAPLLVEPTLPLAGGGREEGSPRGNGKSNFNLKLNGASVLESKIQLQVISSTFEVPSHGQPLSEFQVASIVQVVSCCHWQ